MPSSSRSSLSMDTPLLNIAMLLLFQATNGEEHEAHSCRLHYQPAAGNNEADDGDDDDDGGDFDFAPAA
ncbi:unnamed protein product [Linum trigynum]|uniref:Secreted protein n=1 Tax=Linum trigynum TaxID=586398 RepID=A0AAV2CTC7_9ROSI